MQFSTIKNVFVALSAFAVLGASQPVTNGTMKWTNDAGNITLYGQSTTQIMAQLKAIDPSWTPNSASVPALNVSYSNGQLFSHSSGHKLDANGDALANGFCCPVNDFVAQLYNPYVQNAADALTQLGGSTILYPGCITTNENVYGGAAIWVCLDSGEASIDFSEVAEIVRTIMVSCPRDGSGRTCGQYFYSNYNVVVSNYRAASLGVHP